MTLFGTAGIRGDVGSEVTPALALRVGAAAGRDGDAFVLGRDGRTTSPALADALAAGLQSAGADVTRVGTVPTPTLAYASSGRRGAMITASHNPPSDNGIKLFADGVEYDGAQERRIEERVDDEAGSAPWADWGEEDADDVLAEYRSAVATYAGEHGADPSALTVAVDCGNGMAGLATPQVLRRLGADVLALEANVDGHFPARGSKPTPETLASLREFTASTDADLGIGHDGDADRIVIVDDDGEVVHEDTVVAVLAEHYARAADADDPVVVTTPNASGRIDERVAAAGGTVERVHLGGLHEGIAAADGPVAFAAEPWKHVHPAFGGWIDGVASAAVLVRLVADAGLDGLREPIDERPYRKESVDCPDAAKAAVLDRLSTSLPERFPEAAVDPEYGVRLDFPDGSWTLVRPSGTEPYVRVYAESDDVDELIDDVVESVEAAVDAVGESIEAANSEDDD